MWITILWRKTYCVTLGFRNFIPFIFFSLWKFMWTMKPNWRYMDYNNITSNRKIAKRTGNYLNFWMFCMTTDFELLLKYTNESLTIIRHHGVMDNTTTCWSEGRESEVLQFFIFYYVLKTHRKVSHKYLIPRSNVFLWLLYQRFDLDAKKKLCI